MRFTLGKIASVVALGVLSLNVALAEDALVTSEKDLTKISTYAAKGDQLRLQEAITIALNNSMSINEIKEILIQTYAYAGFPRALNAINSLITVLDKRQSEGIKDKVGKSAQKVDIDNKFEYGNQTQIRLIGGPTTGRYKTEVPTIDRFLKEHLFADIFSRGILDDKQREISTVAVLASIEGLTPQLSSHLKVALHTGVSADKLYEVLDLTGSIKGRSMLDEIVGRNTYVIPSLTILKASDTQKVEANKRNFKGKVQVSKVLESNTPLNLSSGIVYFDKGAKTNWHSHPYGQLLIIKNGHGVVQIEGQTKADVYKDDIVYIPPNVKHYHGASDDEAMEHYAFATYENGVSATWFDEVK